MNFKITYTLLIALFTVSCTTYDDIEPYYNSINIQVPNLIQIETQTNYHLQDTLFVNALFSRYLPESNYPDLLDIYKTTKADKFIFQYSLYKKTAYNNYTQINVSNHIAQIKGSFHNYYVASLYNPFNQKYELRFGIPLLERGEYKLMINKEMHSYDDYYANEGIPVNIITSVSNLSLVADNNQFEYPFIVQ